MIRREVSGQRLAQPSVLENSLLKFEGGNTMEPTLNALKRASQMEGCSVHYSH